LTEVAQEDSGEVEGDSAANPLQPTAKSAGKSDGPSDEALVVNNVLEEVSKSRESDPAGDSSRVFVPGYGWVAWSDPLLDAQARYLSLIHRPAPQQVRYRMRWRVVPQKVAEAERCRFCGQEWQCAEAAWAASRLAHSARQRGGGGRRIAGKHRARLIDRLTQRRSGAGATPVRRMDPVPEI
jgi:hypothetical protein